MAVNVIKIKAPELASRMGLAPKYFRKNLREGIDSGVFVKLGIERAGRGGDYGFTPAQAQGIAKFFASKGIKFTPLAPVGSPAKGAGRKAKGEGAGSPVAPVEGDPASVEGEPIA